MGDKNELDDAFKFPKIIVLGSVMHWITNYSAIFFDLDGLLVNTEPLHYKAYQILFTNHKIAFPWNFSTYISITNMSSTGLYNAIITYAPRLLECKNWKKLNEEKQEIYHHLLKEDNVSLMPGVQEVLAIIQSATLPHTIVTHSTNKQLNLILQQCPLLKNIPYTITREEYPNPKPAPDSYLKAMKKVNIYDNILGFEDSIKGIEALKSASITPILVRPLNHLQSQTIKQLSFVHYTSFKELLKAENN